MLRRATPEDVSAIAELYERSFATLDFLPVLHTVDEHRAWFAGVVARHEVWVWDEACSIRGFAAISDSRLEYLYVEPVDFGRAIGSSLFDRVTERRPDGFDLWTFQQNERARRFYERRGCVAVEFTDGSRNEERTPDVRYEWRPPSPGSPVR